MKHSIPMILLAAVLPLAATPAQISSPAPVSPALLKAVGTSAATVQSLPYLRNTRQRFQTSVVLGGIRRTLDLYPHSLRAPGYKVFLDDGKSLREVAPPVETTYTGMVVGIADSILAFSVYDGQLTGQIHYGKQAWTIEPVNKFIKTASPRDHVVHGAVGRGIDLAKPHATLNQCDLSADFDNDFYKANGSNVNQTLAAGGAIMAVVDLIYRRDCEICYRGPNSIIRTTATYTKGPDACALLAEMESRWNTNHGNFPRDAALLFSGVQPTRTSALHCGNAKSICNLAKAYVVTNAYAPLSLNNKAVNLSRALAATWGATTCLDTKPICTLLCWNVTPCMVFGPKASAAMKQYKNSLTCLSVCQGCQHKAEYTYFGTGCKGTGSGGGGACLELNWTQTGLVGGTQGFEQVALPAKSGAQPMTIQAVEFRCGATANQTASMTVHVWASNRGPTTELGSSPSISLSAGTAVYRGTLSKAVTIPANTNFYVGYTVPIQHQNKFRPPLSFSSGTPVQPCVKFQKTAPSWNCSGMFLRYNYRVICNGKNATPLLTSELPRIGRAYELKVERARPTAIAALFQAITSTSIDLTAAGAPGCTLYVDLGSIFDIQGVATNGAGTAVFKQVLPNDTQFCGIKFNQQVIVHDPGANRLTWVLTRRGEPKTGQ